MALPSVWRSYARVLTVRRPSLAPAGAAVGGASLGAARVVPPAGRLSAYRRICGFPADARALPLTYPHVLAMPLHLALLTGPKFPVRFMGLVHLRNAIRAHRPIPDAAPLDLRCTLDGPRETERGQEFDLVTEVRLDGALAWSETGVLLARRPRSGGARAAGANGWRPPGARIARWELPPDLGRRYAAASGDWNPIHLAAATARPFGFERAIVHGMWSLARCAAELDPRGEAIELEAAFKLPVLLPSAVALHARREGGRAEFALTDGEGLRPHVTGTLRLG